MNLTRQNLSRTKDRDDHMYRRLFINRSKGQSTSGPLPTAACATSSCGCTSPRRILTFLKRRAISSPSSIEFPGGDKRICSLSMLATDLQLHLAQRLLRSSTILWRHLLPVVSSRLRGIRYLPHAVRRRLTHAFVSVCACGQSRSTKHPEIPSRICAIVIALPCFPQFALASGRRSFVPKASI